MPENTKTKTTQKKWERGELNWNIRIYICTLGSARNYIYIHTLGQRQYTLRDYVRNSRHPTPLHLTIDQMCAANAVSQIYVLKTNLNTRFTLYQRYNTPAVGRAKLWFIMLQCSVSVYTRIDKLKREKKRSLRTEKKIVTGRT